MAKHALPSPSLLRQLLDYDPDTGRLSWRVRDISMFCDGEKWTAYANCKRWNTNYSGQSAFMATTGNGYRTGSIEKRTLHAHRVIWAMVHGEWPNVIDHINGDRSDNRLINLRNVNPSENSRNSCISIKNKSGVTGVDWCGTTRKWRVQIKRPNGERYIRTYLSFDEAKAARKKLEIDFGYHLNHGRPRIMPNP